MATRRMMTRLVTDDDNFMALSASAQALYLHLNMGADDDGFNNQVTISMFKAHASIDDLKSLLEKRYIYQFENGVIVIKHWRMANALRKDRYTPTVWQEEFKQLQIKDNDAYTLNGNQMATNWQPNGNQLATQISIGKEREEKDSIDKGKKHLYGEYRHVRLTDAEYEKLHNDFGNADELIKYLDEAIEMKGYKYESHYLAIRKWVVDAVKKDHQQPKQKRLPDFPMNRPEPQISEEEREKQRQEASDWYEQMMKEIGYGN